MKELFRTYYYRLFHEKSTWVFFVLSLVFTLIQVVIMALIKKFGGYTDGSLAIIHSNLLFSGAFYIVVAFLFLYITRDWKDGTFRNLTLAGKTRNQIFFAALLVSVSIFLVFMASSLGLAWIIGSISGFPVGLNSASAIMAFFVSWGMSFFFHLVIIAITVSFAFLIPSAFGSLGAFVGSLLALQIIASLASLLAYSIGGQSASTATSQWFLGNDLNIWGFYFSYSYYLDSSFPFVNWLYKSLIVGLSISGIFVFFGRLSFISRDLK